MNAIIAIALLALSLFGPGWSSQHKAFWEWQLGRQLEGYEEHRLSRGWHPDGGRPLFGNPGSRSINPGSRSITPGIIELYCTATWGGELVCEGRPPK